MGNSTKTIKGKVHGKTIELERELDLPEGQEVQVSVELISQPMKPGEGLRRWFGAWAQDAEELDKFLEWNRQQRKLARRAF